MYYYKDNQTTILTVGLLMLIPLFLVSILLIFISNRHISGYTKTYKVTLKDNKTLLKCKLMDDYAFIEIRIISIDGIAVIGYIIDSLHKKHYLTNSGSYGININMKVEIDGKDVYFQIEKTEELNDEDEIPNSSLLSDKLIVDLSINTRNI